MAGPDSERRYNHSDIYLAPCGSQVEIADRVRNDDCAVNQGSRYEVRYGKKVRRVGTFSEVNRFLENIGNGEENPLQPAEAE